MQYHRGKKWGGTKPPIGAQIDWGDPINAGLIGYWPFLEGAGNTVRNLANPRGTGTLTSGPAWSVGKFGNAISFDGTNDTIAVADETLFDFDRTQPFSVVAWVYPNNTSDVVHSVISKIDSSSPNSGWGLILHDGSTSTALYMSICNTGTTNELALKTANGTIVANTWQQVALTYDGSSTVGGVHLLINGVSKTLTTAFNNLSASTLNNITPYIGSRNNAGQFMNGRIDNLRIVSRKMTDGEIWRLFTDPFAGLTKPNRRNFRQTQAVITGGGARRNRRIVPPYTKPPIGTPVNLGHQLTEGLQFFLLFPENGGAPFDAMGQRYQWTMNNTPTWIPSLDSGPAMNFPAAGTAFVSGANASYPDTPWLGAISLVWRGLIRTGSAFRHFAGKHLTSGSTANPFDFRTENSANPLLVLARANTASAAWTRTVVTTTLNAVRTYGVSAPATIETAPMFYFNGVGQVGNSLSGAGTGAPTGANAAIQIGRRADGVVQMDGYSVFCAGWNRQLTPTEQLQMYQDPYQIFIRPRLRRMSLIPVTAPVTGGVAILSGGILNSRILGKGIVA